MLNFNEKNFISDFFNAGGYVLDFSNEKFDEFTINSIGIPLQSYYKLSKGKSLNEFINNATDGEIIKLSNDLLTYIEYNDIGLEKRQIDFLPKLKRLVADNLENNKLNNNFSKELKTKFDDEYINSQIDLMTSLLETSTADVIGKSKELLESCFKFILDECGESYSNSAQLLELRKQVFVKLNLDAKNNNSARTNDDVKKILNSFNTIIDGINSLRNNEGDGHGKSRGFKELPKRYALLVMNSSFTVSTFILDTYLELYKNI